jgi:uroporphyrinogen-III synthase
MVSKPGVLVTRPQGQADELSARLVAAGYAVHCLPLLELRSLTELPPAQRALVLELDRYQHIIFISGNAVHFGMSVIEDYWPQLPVGLCWYAIGNATARLLQQYGIEAITPGSSMTSEGLLAVSQLRAVAGQRVLIIKGEGGRNTLREELTSRGATVDELACYRRVCPGYGPGEVAAKLSQWHIRLVMITSGEGLANLLALISAQETTKFRDITLLVPSDRIAGLARQAGFDQVMIAENASDSAMLRALEPWQPSSENDE